LTKKDKIAWQYSGCTLLQLRSENYLKIRENLIKKIREIEAVIFTTLRNSDFYTFSLAMALKPRKTARCGFD